LMEPLSVAEATRRVMNSHVSLLDALRLGVVNYSSLAEHIKPEVEKQVGRKVSVDAVKMALIRFSDELSETYECIEKKISDILCRSVLELKNDLVVVVLRPDAFIRLLPKLPGLMEKARLIQITQGTDTFTVVLDLTLLRELRQTVGDRGIVEVIDDQSCIILISPPEITKTPGVISYITHLIASRGINITQIVSCHTDTIFIVNREDALKTYSTIEHQILLLRKTK